MAGVYLVCYTSRSFCGNYKPPSLRKASHFNFHSKVSDKLVRCDAPAAADDDAQLKGLNDPEDDSS